MNRQVTSLVIVQSSEFNLQVVDGHEVSTGSGTDLIDTAGGYDERVVIGREVERF